ncbi:MAG: hypothetical protein J6P61_01470 [Erysipelotrichaceae bacterium]|nr:hypothetical protein [Erysipelotrichaceae bacterium]
MTIRSYLEKNQPYFLNVIQKSIQNHKLSHAYLIVGEADEASLYLAQSILCRKDTLACEECDICRRVANHNYPDFITYDGNEGTIKKEYIESIQREFNKKAFEGGKKVYLLKSIENSSTVAMNSLLKFLEEPVDDVHAILTTKNLNKVLPTIQSRCQIIRLLPESKEMLIRRLMNEGFDEEDATIAVSIVNHYEECKELLESDDYNHLKDNALFFVEDYFNAPMNLMFNQQIQISQKYKSNRKIISIYLNMVLLAFRDVFHVKHNVGLVFTNHEMLFKNCPNDDRILEKIEIILDTIKFIENNANIPLAIDGMVYKILEGVTHG